MKPVWIICCCAVLLIAGSRSFVSAQDDDSGPTLSQFTLGEHVAGEEVDLTKLQGRVVAIEYWGTR